MRAMVLRGKALAIEDVEVPKPGPMQVLAKVLACGICGSDLHAAKYMDDMITASRLSGSVAWDSRAETAAMVMGHEFVAEVVEAGPGAESWTPGTRVTSVPVLIDPSSPNGMTAIGYSTVYPGAYGQYVLMSGPMLLRVPDGLANTTARSFSPSRKAAMSVVSYQRRAPGGTSTSFASAAHADRQFGRIVTSAKRRIACA